MAVRKHNFLRTSPAEARNTLIRMPAEMKRDGGGVKRRERSRTSTDALGLLSLKHTRTAARTNKEEGKKRGSAPARCAEFIQCGSVKSGDMIDPLVPYLFKTGYTRDKVVLSATK